MEQQSGFDLTLSVRLQQWEKEENAAFYEGIYGVYLNRFVTIMFVPEFRSAVESWPPELPEDVDIVPNAHAARLYTIQLADYSVTPDADRAGQVDRLSLKPLAQEQSTDATALYSHTATIFYVEPDAFSIYEKELENLANLTPSIHHSLAVSSVRPMKVIQFILNTLLTSPELSQEHRDIIQG